MKKFACLVLLVLLVGCITKPAVQSQYIQPEPSPFDVLVASDLVRRYHITCYPLFTEVENWTIRLSLFLADETIDIVGMGLTQSRAEHKIMQQYEKHKALIMKQWCGDD